MLRPGQTAKAQNQMVYQTLSSLLTPVMPPIYRTFMSGTYWQRWLGSSFGIYRRSLLELVCIDVSNRFWPLCGVLPGEKCERML